MGVKGNLPALIESFLFERQQSVVLIGQESEWLTIKAGVSHRSVLGSLFIYIYKQWATHSGQLSIWNRKTLAQYEYHIYIYIYIYI